MKKYLALFVLLLAGLAAVYWFFVPIQATTYKMDLLVKEPRLVGFNLDTDAIHFGTAPPGGTGERAINVRNNEKPARVTVKTAGDLAPWLTVSESSFRLGPLENKSVTFYAKVPASARQGNYTGTATILFYLTI